MESLQRVALALAAVIGTFLLAGAIGNAVGEAVSERAGQRAATLTVALAALAAAGYFIWRRRRPGNPPGAA